MSANAKTPTGVHDDGKFIRTSLIVGEDSSGNGSIDVMHAKTGELLARINIFTNEDGSWFAVDVIDIEDRFDAKKAITFTDSVRDFIPSDHLVAADFRMLEE